MCFKKHKQPKPIEIPTKPKNSTITFTENPRVKMPVKKPKDKK